MTMTDMTAVITLLQEAINVQFQALRFVTVAWFPRPRRSFRSPATGTQPTAVNTICFDHDDTQTVNKVSKKWIYIAHRHKNPLMS